MRLRRVQKIAKQIVLPDPEKGQTANIRDDRFRLFIRDGP
jgi:hypothetical protein